MRWVKISVILETIKFENDDYSIKLEVFDEEENSTTSTEITCKVIELLNGIGYRFPEEVWDEVAATQAAVALLDTESAEIQDARFFEKYCPTVSVTIKKTCG